jgi:deoxyribodipyrimidine photo-lyase
MSQQVVLFWFRRDLRLHDNNGLFQALSSGLPVVPLFIFDSDTLLQLEDKDDQRVNFIYHSLQQLQQDLMKSKSTLQLCYGKPSEVFQTLSNTYSVHAVFTNHDYEPYAIQRDAAIRKLLQAKGVAFYTFKDQVIFERDEIVKDDGSGYRVYTPYARKWKSALNNQKFKAWQSEKLQHNFFQQSVIQFPTLEEMGFKTSHSKFPDNQVDENIILQYHQSRDIPSLSGTTRIGVHLRFGTVSIRQLVAKTMALNQVYLGELIWREFFMQILWQHPDVVNEPFKKEYNAISWRNKEDEFTRWCNGETGYPLVDAGMRELNATGFMHNRVRMITASFLVKHLLIDWRWGEAYFARKLMDYELSSNNGNWQWVAGCGCDAAPYFRVFNPTIQAKKFDPQSLYIKKWVPEIDSFTYPKQIVEHDFARQRCIKTYKAVLFKG